MMRIVTGALTGVLFVSLAVPAHAANREHQQLMADIRMLQEQNQQLQLVLATLGDTLASLNAKLDDQAVTARKQFADQKLLIDNMANDVRVVRERTDDTNLRIATLREELEALRTQMLQMQQAAAAAPPPVIDPNAPVDPNAPPAEPAPIALAPLPSTLGLSPTRMLDTARSDYVAGQYALAITGFEQFLKAFPRSESAGEAQFYIGEANYSQNRFPEAIAAYNAVIQTYPMSSSVPEAYYKRGVAEERAGQIDAARASWEAVIKAYPDSDGARLAKQRLDGLSRQPRTP